MFYILSFFFGASIGSFVQVVVTRLHVAPLIKSRSKCLSCGEALRASDLIPLLSHLYLRGKCRYCSVPFGHESLVVESIFGTVFVLLYTTIIIGQPSIAHAVVYFLYYSVLFGVLGIIALYDRKHTYIPVSFLLLFCVLAFMMFFVRYIGEPTSFVLLGPFLVALPFLLPWIVTKGKWVGFGDVLLFLGVGAFFGVTQGMAVLMISVWMGAIVGIISQNVNKNKKTMNVHIPFVPFIVIAFLIVLFTDVDIFSIANSITR